MIFMALIDQKPDSQDHLSHLVITRAEKSELQDQLEIMLKDVSEKGDHDYYISAAIGEGQSRVTFDWTDCKRRIIAKS